MKYLKLSADYGEHKSGATIQLEDAEAVFVVKDKKGAEVPAPDGVKTKMAELQEAALNRLVEQIGGGVLNFIEAKSGDKNKRPGYKPNITVHPDNVLEDPTDGFKSASEFYSCVRAASMNKGLDSRLELRAKAAGASENVNADGGYATPLEYATNIFNDIIAQDSLFNECQTIPMSSNSMKLPALNYTKQGSFGVTAYWEGEAATIPTSKPNYRQPNLTLNKLTVLTPVTSELLEDGIAIESTINFLASEAMTYMINDSIINGTGAGMPVGVVGHPSTVAIARTTALSVVRQDVISMDGAFIGNDMRAMWLISKGDVQPALLNIQDPAGRNLYFAPGTFGEVKGPANMLGNRVRPLINCQTIGTSGDIILWDPKNYVVGYKSSGVSKAMSIHLYFATDQVAYRWTFRMDGRPWRDTTLLAAKSNSLAYGTAITLTTKLS